MGTAISITSVKAHFDRVRGRMKTKVNKAEQIIGRYARLRVRAREIGRLWSNCVKTIGSDFSSHILFLSWIIFQWSHRVSYVDVIFIKECKRCRRRRRRHRRECKILSGSIRNARDECGCWWTQTHTHRHISGRGHWTHLPPPTTTIVYISILINMLPSFDHIPQKNSCMMLTGNLQSTKFTYTFTYVVIGLVQSFKYDDDGDNVGNNNNNNKKKCICSG